MKKIRVAINGFGRIGRAFLRQSIERDEIEVVAINDLGDIENLAYLLRYDTAYGPSGLEIETEDNTLVINGKRIAFLSEKDPSLLPWSKLNIDVVVEATGFFDSYEKSKAHIDAGTKKVVITAPVKDQPLPGIPGDTILMSVNDDKLNTCRVTSNGSCTTNSVSPVIKILDEAIGVKKAMLTTIHAYTATQKIVDGPDAKDFRRGRAAAQNLVPSSTGAATAVTQVLTNLDKKFDGISVRVPVVAGSLSDVTFVAKRPTSADEVNKILREAAGRDEWRGIFAVAEEPLCSSDIVGNTNASIAQLDMTRVVDGDLVKVLAWYDNEMGYTHTLIEHVIKSGQVL